jgi:alpha-tubulin suppressor-like RCC1 family protein
VKGAVGVAAGRYHSVYWTEDALYTWGLNAGQLGHLKVQKTDATDPCNIYYRNPCSLVQILIQQKD